MTPRDILKRYVVSDDLVDRLERYLVSISTDEEEQRFILYDVLSSASSGAEAVRLLKERAFGFTHPHFHTIRRMVEEQEGFLNRSVDVEDGVVQCHRCKSFKTFSYAKQTRASDEGTTVFVTCCECKLQFRL